METYKTTNENISRIERKKLNKHIILSTILASLSSFSFGVSLTGIECIKEATSKCELNQNRFYNSCIELSKLEWASLISVYTIGALTSNLFINKINLPIKRKIIYNNFLYILGTLCIFLLSNFYVLLFGRFTIGLAIGITCSVIPSYLNIIAPITIRGLIGSFHQFGIVTGVLVGQILAYNFHKKETWRIGIAMIIIFMAVHTLCLVWIKNIEEIWEESEDEVGIKKLITAKMARKSLFIAVLMHLAQQMSCINGVIFYSNKILESTSNSRLYTVYVGVMSLISSIFSMFVVDMFGRKVMMISSCLIVSIGLFLLTFNLVVVTALFIFIFGFNIGLGPVVWFITNEIFPSNYKKAASTIAVGVNWISNLFIALFFPFILDKLGNYSFSIYAVSMILVALYLKFCFCETKGKMSDFQ